MIYCSPNLDDSFQEKKPFTTKAAELKEEYQKALGATNDAENENEKTVSTSGVLLVLCILDL